jgi:hypothetical protein
MITNKIGRSFIDEQILFVKLTDEIQKYYMLKFDFIFNRISRYLARDNRNVQIDNLSFFDDFKNLLIGILIHLEPNEEELLAHIQTLNMQTIQDKNLKERILIILDKWYEVVTTIGNEELDLYFLKNNNSNPKFEQHLEEKGLETYNGYRPKGSKILVFGNISEKDFNEHMCEYDEDFSRLTV